MPVPEGDLLLPKDPKIEDSDDWPLYTLRKTKVTSNKTGEPVSLLSAHDDHPVTVLGTLERVDDDLKSNIKDQKYYAKTVKLHHITDYAFAEYEDGTYGFWAAGQAGWFELKQPAPRYKPVFEAMNEAASMFYLLADKVRRSHKTNWKLSVKGFERYMNVIFKDYLLHGKNSGRRVHVDDVREGFHEHREYLITCMLEAQEGLDWEKSPIFNYFKHKFTDLFKEIEERIARHRGGPDPKADYEKPASPKKPGRPGRPPKTTARRNRRGAHLNQPRTPIKGKAEAVEPSNTSSSSSSSDDDNAAAAVQSPLHTSRKRKSILQPKGSKYSKKGTGGCQPTRTCTINQDPTSNDDSDSDHTIDDASPLATAAPRPTNNTEAPPAKKKLLSALDDYPSYHDHLPRPCIEKKLAAYTLPSTEPHGPGDLWTCTFEGCRQRVHGASTPEGQERMKAHFMEHAEAAQKKIDLALKESRPYLPVDNLIRHLQRFTEIPDHLDPAKFRHADDVLDVAEKTCLAGIERSGC